MGGLCKPDLQNTSLYSNTSLFHRSHRSIAPSQNSPHPKPRNSLQRQPPPVSQRAPTESCPPYSQSLIVPCLPISVFESPRATRRSHGYYSRLPLWQVPFVKHITPALDTEYGISVGLPSLPAIEAMFTILP